MSQYTEFLMLANSGDKAAIKRELFFVHDSKERHFEMQHLFDMANAAGLDAYQYVSERTIKAGPMIAYFRIAHPNSYSEVRGYEWRAIHGLDCFDKYANCDEIVGALKARVR